MHKQALKVLPVLPLFSYTGTRLHEAWTMQEFLGSCEGELTWMRDADALLSNDDIGKDLQEVRFLLKKHQVKIIHECMFFSS